MVSIGDTVKLSLSVLSFIRDFRGQEEYEDMKDSVLLVIDLNRQGELTVLNDDGEVIMLEASDVQLFSKSS